MNSDLLIGTIIGGGFVAAVWTYSGHIYRRILVRKAGERSAEFINGKPYYIIPEGEWIDANRLATQLDRVLVWVEEPIGKRRAELRERWMQLNERNAPYYCEVIAREDAEFEDWKKPVTEANRMLDTWQAGKATKGTA